MLTTITFPIEKIDNDTIQLIIEFTTSLTGTDRQWDAREKGMLVEKWGVLEMAYEIDQALLVPSTLGLSIGDRDGLLDNLFFGSDSIAVTTAKEAKITIKVNGINKFVGHIIEDSIESDITIHRIKFDAAPKTDIINKRMVYDDTGVSLNPFIYTQSTSLSIINNLLLDIYKLVNPSLTGIDVVYDWEFQGSRTTNECYLNIIKFEDLYQSVDELYFDTSFGISTCGDVLRKLALDWCSFTGMISYDKAFFKKLFHYNANNVQTVDVLFWQKNYKYGLIDYVKIEVYLSDPNQPYEEGTFTQLQDRYLNRKSLPAFFVADGFSGTNVEAVISSRGDFVFDTGSTITNPPSEWDVYSNNSSEFEVIGTPFPYGDTEGKITTRRISGTNDPDASGTLTKVSGLGDATYSYSSWGNSDGTYYVYQARDPNLFNNEFKNSGALLAKFWYNFRSNIQNCRVDKFKFKGIDYDFLKDFIYNSSKYQVISLRIHYAENYSECEAIYIGEYTAPFQ